MPANGWRALRKGAREILTLQACQNHLGIQRAEASQLMYDLLARSEKVLLEPLQLIDELNVDKTIGFLHFHSQILCVGHILCPLW
jgi:hypothetical protein